MTTFFVDDSGLVTTASTAGDSIYVQSAAVPLSTLLGLAGNDTINLTEGAATNNSSLGIKVEAADGDDSITISSLAAFSAGNHSIYGGDGVDTIAITGSTIGLLKTQDGADTIIFSGGTLVEGKFGKGADEIIVHDGTVTQLGLGKGHDKISAGVFALGTAASISGGEGRDTITLTLSTESGALIQGDGVNGVNANADVLTIDGLTTGTTVQGGGGGDTIQVSGDAATSLLVAGNAGNDSIVISGYEGDTTVAGGAGVDTILVNENIAASAFFFGGNGADSITIELAVAGAGATQVDGGTGADSITFSSNAAAATTISGATLGTMQYSSFTESDLAATDVIGVSTIVSGSNSILFNYGVDLTAGSVTENSAIAALGKSNFSGNITNGVATFSGSENVSSVTAVAGTLDTLTVGTQYSTVLFQVKGGSEYLFVQGGTAGTSDDSVVSFGGDINASGDMALSIAATNTATVTFSGAS